MFGRQTRLPVDIILGIPHSGFIIYLASCPWYNERACCQTHHSRETNASLFFPMRDASEVIRKAQQSRVVRLVYTLHSSQRSEENKMVGSLWSLITVVEKKYKTTRACCTACVPVLNDFHSMESSCAARSCTVFTQPRITYWFCLTLRTVLR